MSRLDSRPFPVRPRYPARWSPWAAESSWSRGSAAARTEHYLVVSSRGPAPVERLGQRGAGGLAFSYVAMTSMPLTTPEGRPQLPGPGSRPRGPVSAALAHRRMPTPTKTGVGCRPASAALWPMSRPRPCSALVTAAPVYCGLAAPAGAERGSGGWAPSPLTVRGHRGTSSRASTTVVLGERPDAGGGRLDEQASRVPGLPKRWSGHGEPGCGVGAGGGAAHQCPAHRGAPAILVGERRRERAAPAPCGCDTDDVLKRARPDPGLTSQAEPRSAPVRRWAGGVAEDRSTPAPIARLPLRGRGRRAAVRWSAASTRGVWRRAAPEPSSRGGPAVSPEVTPERDLCPGCRITSPRRRAPASSCGGRRTFTPWVAPAEPAAPTLQYEQGAGAGARVRGGPPPSAEVSWGCPTGTSRAVQAMPGRSSTASRPSPGWRWIVQAAASKDAAEAQPRRPASACRRPWCGGNCERRGQAAGAGRGRDRPRRRFRGQSKQVLIQA